MEPKLPVSLLALVLTTAALAGCTDEGGDDDDDDGVTNLYLKAEILVGDTATTLTLEQRGGDRITWELFAVSVDNEVVSSPRDADGNAKPECERGEITYFTLTHGDYTEGEEYWVHIINAKEEIVCEEDVIAESDEDDVITLNMSSSLEVGQTETNLTLEHRGGNKIVWANYEVRCGDDVFTINPTDSDGNAMTETEVGERAYFTCTHGDYSVGESYTVTIIDMDADIIAWQKAITAKEM